MATRSVKVGAYYFDGWSGDTDHLSKRLLTDFADRKPVWGWKDDTVEIMQQQVDFCADHGINFWAFDWYYPEGEKKETPLNHALALFQKTPNRDRMQFCLLVANHEGFRMGPKDWDDCCRIWIDLFRQPTHLRLNHRPLLIFFSPSELDSAFGGPDGVHKAFDSLRSKARDAGIPDVAICGCAGPGGNLADLVHSGYTMLTGYNYNNGWMDGGGSMPFTKLIETSSGYYDQFAKLSPLPYIPVVTIGWDRRPWELDQLPPEKRSVWYPDRSPQLVEKFVRTAVDWLDQHPDKATEQRMILLYAWNENGEGGYLTPTEADGTEYLKAVKRALQK
ncbi:MAG: glycoside hydrolase family 99-like domain-containing protein [Verrucomicrobiota bacterium]